MIRFLFQRPKGCHTEFLNIVSFFFISWNLAGGGAAAVNSEENNGFLLWWEYCKKWSCKNEISCVLSVLINSFCGRILQTLCVAVFVLSRVFLLDVCWYAPKRRFLREEQGNWGAVWNALLLSYTAVCSWSRLTSQPDDADLFSEMLCHLATHFCKKWMPHQLSLV